MYALEIISKYLRDNECRSDYHAETLISALEIDIVMKNNIIKFGDVYKSKFLVLPWASPQLHPGLQSTREYTKMSMFLSGQHMLNSFGVS